MLQQNFATKTETNQTLKKKENMENLLPNFQTRAKMTKEIEAGVEVIAQKVVNKVENVTKQKCDKI